MLSSTSARPTTPPIARPLPTPFATVSRSGDDVVRLVAPEVVAGAAEAGLHLVGDEEDAVVGEHLVQRTEETVGRCREATDTLDGLGDHARDITTRAHVDHVAQVLDARGGVRIVVEVAVRAPQSVSTVHERDLEPGQARRRPRTVAP